MATFITRVPLDMENDINFYNINYGDINYFDYNTIQFSYTDWTSDNFYGYGFTDYNRNLTGGGIVNGYYNSNDYYGTDNIEISGISIPLYSILLAATTTSNADDLAIIQTALAGNDNIVGSDYGDNLAGFDGNDYVLGNGGNDTLKGGDGNDQLSGGAGNDILIGGSGADVMFSGDGNDHLVITAATEVVAGDWYDGGNGFDEIDIYTSAPVNLSATTISNVESLYAFGPVILTTGQLNGFSLLQTGTISLATSGAVNLSGATVITQTFNLNDGGNTLGLAGSSYFHIVNGGLGSDVVRGGDAGNILFGNGGNDSMTGGAANDKLAGGAGNEVLFGGAGSDTFVFDIRPSAANADKILDFHQRTEGDLIALDNSIFTGIGPDGHAIKQAAFWKNTTGHAHDATDRIIYETDTGWLNYDRNGNVPGGEVHIAKLVGHPALTYDHIWAF
jgi:Ca2+-binding RTX toxin-like protein